LTRAQCQIGAEATHLICVDGETLVRVDCEQDVANVRLQRESSDVGVREEKRELKKGSSCLGLLGGTGEKTYIDSILLIVDAKRVDDGLAR
jgi:hypothetical protein